jgi:hypothetical protein
VYISIASSIKSKEYLTIGAGAMLSTLEIMVKAIPQNKSTLYLMRYLLR